VEVITSFTDYLRTREANASEKRALDAMTKEKRRGFQHPRGSRKEVIGERLKPARKTHIAVRDQLQGKRMRPADERKRRFAEKLLVLKEQKFIEHCSRVISPSKHLLLGRKKMLNRRGKKGRMLRKKK